MADGLRFVQNKGQWEREVLFRADIPGGFLFLKKQSLVYVLYDGREISARHARQPLANANNQARLDLAPATTVKAHGVEVLFEGGNANALILPTKPDSSEFNYFIGNDPSRWASGAAGFGEVFYKDIYPGVDFRIYAYQYTIKYEFIVRPGADASRIRLNYSGAEGISVNKNGQLEVVTSIGAFKEAKPYSFQEIAGRTKEVNAAYAVEGQKVRFALPNGYDRTHALTIDPELVFSSYSGSLSDNWGHTATSDPDGNLFSGGTVFGASFPVMVGAFQVNFGGLVDTGILKYTQDGTRLMYTTFLGATPPTSPIA